jgi:hypothetical protein
MELDLSRKVFVYKMFWPASVLLPDRTAWHRCRVYVTDQGLAVFRTRAEQPHFLSPMDWVHTSQPHQPRNHVGIDLMTEAGLVVITKTGVCGCGSSLKGWRPTWAGNVMVWPQQIPHE